MYAMSWELNNNDYKYESIQHGYTVEFDEYENDGDVSLDELLEKELEIEEMEIEGEVF
jgi:hypothetical protein